MAQSLQDIIANTPAGGIAALPPGEYEGPVSINRPITLRGSNSTIWAKHGAVIEVNSGGVTLEGLRVEITEGELSETAIAARCPVSARGVEVLGTVSGFGGEDGACEIPRALQLGELSPDGENSFRMTVDIPAPARLVCGAAGIRFVPETLPAGRSDVCVFVSGSGSASLVYAEVLLCSGFCRRIYLSGRFSAGAPAVQDRLLFTAAQVTRTGTQGGTAPAAHSGVPAGASAEVPQPPTDVITDVGAAPLPDIGMLELKKGQRVPVGQYISGAAELYLTGQKKGEADIDPYVFLLDENERSRDDGLVFFGNECSRSEAVRYHRDDGHITIDLALLPADVKRVTVAYSVYSGDSRKNFSLVSDPRLSLYSQGRERIRFDIGGLTNEVTIIAAEFYIYHGEWRLSAVGSGYRDGLVKLCNRYGIQVST